MRTHIRFVCALVVGLILLLAAVALAAPASQPVVTAATSAAVSDLLNQLLKLVGLTATTIVTVLLKRWLGGKVSADTQEMYSELALDAIGHVEEMAHQAVKTNAAKLDSNAKLNAAVGYVVKEATALKLEPKAEDAIKALIHAKLGDGRTGA